MNHSNMNNNMKNLLSKDAYHASAFQERKVFWRKMFLFLGGGFGGVMAIMTAFALGPLAVKGPTAAIFLALGIILFVFLTGGVFFASFMVLFFRFSIKRALNKLYDGVGPFACPAPVEEYDFRLPCSWCKTSKLAIGGALYFSNERVFFVPHSRNPKQYRETWHFDKVGISLRVVPFEVPRFQKLFLQDTPQALEIETQKESLYFMVPQLMTTCETIKNRIGQ